MKRKIISLILCAVLVLNMNSLTIAQETEENKSTSQLSETKVDEQVKAVMEQCEAIGKAEYTDDCLRRIEAAEQAYEALSESQKEQVDNYGLLKSARSAYDALAAGNLDTSRYTIKDSGALTSTVNWILYTNGVLEISGTGEIPSYSSTMHPEYEKYSSVIKKIVVRNTITSIGEFAFQDCNNVTSITLPFAGKSREATGWEAHLGYIFGYDTETSHLSGCKGEASFSGRVTLYYGNGTSFTREITTTRQQSSGTTTFINGALNQGKAKTEAWYTCQNGYGYNYRYQDGSGKVDYYDQIQTYYYNIPKTLTEVNISDAIAISDAAFNNCKIITKMSLNENIVAINDYAFQFCVALHDFAIPKSVIALGYGSLQKDIALSEIFIPDGVTRVEANTFNECTGITRLSIGKNVTSIGGSAFKNCTNLKSIVIPNSVRTIENAAFVECYSALTLSLSDNVERIDSHAFDGCRSLTSIAIPDSVSIIEPYAFYGTTNVSELLIGRGIKQIPSYVFGECSSLSEIVVPNTVKIIEESAFSGCNNVTSITLPFVGKSREATGWEAHLGYIFGYDTETSHLSGCKGEASFSGRVTLYYGNGTSFTREITTTRQQSSGTTTFINGALNQGKAKTEAWYTCQNGYGYNYRYQDGSGKVDYYDQIQTYYYNIPKTLTEVNISDAIAISDAAFNNCKNISLITVNIISTNGAYSFQNVPWFQALEEEFCIIGDGCLVKYSGNQNIVNIPETVKTIGGSAFQNHSEITEVVIPDTVKEIGALAFSGCTNLASITIPKTVTSIGREAIPDTCTIYCYQPSAAYSYRSSNREVLNDSYTTGQDTFYYVVDGDNRVEIIGCETTSTEITVPELIEGLTVNKIGDYGFVDCTTLNSITIPANIRSIGKCAFKGCTGLVNATIPTTVNSVGDYAFKDCTQLKNVTISEGVRSIGQGCFSGCISLVEAVVPDTTEVLGPYAFYNCTAMTTASIGITANAVQEYAFYNCTSLNTVVIGISVSEIGDYAFYNCALERVSIPAATERIGKYAFANNKEMVRATHRKGLITIDEFAYSDCEKLNTVTMPSSVTSIKRGAFFNCEALETISLSSGLCDLGKQAFENCCSLPRVTIPEGVTVINDFTFSNCSSLAEVIFQSEATYIGIGAFYNTAFETIALPETLETIDKDAFNHSLNLKNIRVPDAIQSIGDAAFLDCAALEWVSIPDALPNMGTSAFSRNNDLTIEIRYLTGTVADGILTKQGVCHVILDERITDIGARAFAYCYDLSTITYADNSIQTGEYLLSPSVISLGSEVFMDATQLKNLIIPDTIQSIGENAFYNEVVSGQSTDDVTVTFYYVGGSIAASILEDQKIAHIYVRDYISSLGDNAFRSCTILETISLPDTISFCGNDVFKDSSGDVWAYFRGVDGTVDANIYQAKTSGLKALIFDDNISTIGSYAFAESETVERVQIQNTNIVRERAFENAAAIAYVVIEKANTVEAYAFYNNAGRARVEITDIGTLGSYAFADSIAMLSVSIERAQIIGGYAFADDIAIETVVIGTAQTIGSYSFVNDSGIKSLSIEAVQTIENSAFSNCIGMETVSIGSVKTIGDYAFYNDLSITDIVISADLVSIGKHAFEECKLIPELILPETTRAIGEYAFYDCNSMANINIPYGVPAINSHTFFGCASLLKVHLPDTVKRIEDYAYYGCVLIEDLKLGNSVVFIGEYAFYNCNKAVEITLPEILQTIEDYAFRGCSSLKEIYLPNSVTKLGDCVFYGCVGLEQAEFGTGITSIGDRVFYACVSLLGLVLNGDVNYIHELAFYGAEDVTLYAFENEYVEEYCDDQGLIYYNLNRNFEMILTPPTKRDYMEFEELDLTGLQLDLYYPSGLHRIITTGYTVEGFDSTAFGTQTITVTYNGQSDTFDITVTAKTVSKVTILSGAPTSVIIGEELDTSALVIEVLFEDNTTIQLTEGFEISGYKKDKLGLQTITVRYRNASQIFDITVLDYIRGDINGDGIVSIKDVTRLVNYLNDDTVEVIDYALDVNGDGVVSIKDVTRLNEYLNDNSVEIY